jgi:hypothetical protein
METKTNVTLNLWLYTPEMKPVNFSDSEENTVLIEIFEVLRANGIRVDLKPVGETLEGQVIVPWPPHPVVAWKIAITKTEIKDDVATGE